MVNFVSTSFFDSTVISPPWLSTISRLRYKPTPTASAVVLVVKNGSNTLSMMVDSMPMPLS